MKAAKAFNMIVLGGLLKVRPLVEVEDVIHALRKTLPERHHHLIPDERGSLTQRHGNHQPGRLTETSG